MNDNVKKIVFHILYNVVNILVIILIVKLLYSRFYLDKGWNDEYAYNSDIELLDKNDDMNYGVLLENTIVIKSKPVLTDYLHHDDSFECRLLLYIDDDILIKSDIGYSSYYSKFNYNTNTDMISNNFGK